MISYSAAVHQQYISSSTTEAVHDPLPAVLNAASYLTDNEVQQQCSTSAVGRQQRVHIH